MNDHPAQPAEIAALIHDHGEHWQIEHSGDLDVWTAVRRSRDGRHIRVLVARDPASLRGKLETRGSRRARPRESAGCRYAGWRVDQRADAAMSQHAVIVD
jgi:hypothetical protein